MSLKGQQPCIENGRITSKNSRIDRKLKWGLIMLPGNTDLPEGNSLKTYSNLTRFVQLSECFQKITEAELNLNLIWCPHLGITIPESEYILLLGTFFRKIFNKTAIFIAIVVFITGIPHSFLNLIGLNSLDGLNWTCWLSMHHPWTWLNCHLRCRNLTHLNMVEGGRAASGGYWQMCIRD